MGELDIYALLSGKQAAMYAGVKLYVICKWRERGILPVATDPVTGTEIRGDDGRPRYRLLDVAKAENATRQRAEQMARALQRRPAA